MPDRKLLEENIDYRVVPVPKHEQAHLVEVLSGDYAGVFFRYTSVLIDEKTKEIDFGLSVVKTSEEMYALEEDGAFLTRASLIVQSILDQSAKDSTLVLYDAETGDKIEQ